mmetsp:Transcript_37336/g.83082  ORF Transcript_37336/g.83082 Transcript_37336/m.83082 type:complete len:363 (-) Transcript_37336:1554-2642(-)|eukprot:CAMPEP_0202906686 /NCGR_PEP_ID=MMETSP1392-20130828/39996_1 /ASSEMBLY_ACC=CAM_ASM_000868 /TAXON_ID=225041 /ORGANISM="Chlamydomonas chlamydogama, Strain SAG 11-48b" /LENGTH=362 /DNA_ID=CAMNT_0049595313 /DNA_START=241 /DNA_END=1329 /DNA_ORIENTATION=-
MGTQVLSECPNGAAVNTGCSGGVQHEMQNPSGGVEVGTATLPGNRYGGLNQDYCVVQEFYTPAEIPKGGKQAYIVAICDGHGILGDKSANFAGKAIARALYSGALRNKNLSKLPQSELEVEMQAAFRKGHQAANSIYDCPPKAVTFPKASGSSTLVQYNLCNVAGLNLYRCNGKGPEKLLECGCTATAAVIHGRTLCLADVGDSQAVLGHDDGERYHGTIVTERHHGFHKKEAARIKAEHSQWAKLLEDGYLQVIDGPWAGYELSITRALGHKNMEQYGVLSEPYVTTMHLGDKHCCLVIASDGVWDVMNGDEVVTHVMDSVAEGKTAQQAAAALVQHAVELGMSSPQEEADNTSAVVVVFR